MGSQTTEWLLGKVRSASTHPQGDALLLHKYAPTFSVVLPGGRLAALCTTPGLAPTGLPNELASQASEVCRDQGARLQVLSPTFSSQEVIRIVDQTAKKPCDRRSEHQQSQPGSLMPSALPPPGIPKKQYDANHGKEGSAAPAEHGDHSDRHRDEQPPLGSADKAWKRKRNNPFASPSRSCRLDPCSLWCVGHGNVRLRTCTKQAVYGARICAHMGTPVSTSTRVDLLRACGVLQTPWETPSGRIGRPLIPIGGLFTPGGDHRLLSAARAALTMGCSTNGLSQTGGCPPKIPARDNRISRRRRTADPLRLSRVGPESRSNNHPRNRLDFQLGFAG